MKTQRRHALVIPVHGEGHWGPMKVVMRQLVDNGISFTLSATQLRIAEMQSLKDKGEFQGVDRVELLETFDESKYEKDPIMKAVSKEMREEFYSNPSVMEHFFTQKSSGTGPTFLLSDMFLSWTQDVADELGIPRYCFFPSPSAFALVCLQGIQALDEGWYLQNPDKMKSHELMNLPGLENYRGIDLPGSLSISRDVYTLHLEKMHRATGFLINGFEEMTIKEAAGLRTILRNRNAGRKEPRVFFIGPLLLLPTFPRAKARDESAALKERSKCLQFLDSQKTASVLYICFGSVYSIPPSTVAELARGLETSGVAFLWVLRPPKDAPAAWTSSDVLPRGFESRIEGQGLVWTSWAPQKEILAHPSIGGFVSHCGWNSSLEAVCNGVPVIAWPIWAEQALNARLLVSDLKVGLEMKKSAEGDMVAEEVTKSIKLLMASEKGEQMRRKMQHLGIISAATVLEGGDSHQAFQDFLQEVSSPCPV